MKQKFIEGRVTAHDQCRKIDDCGKVHKMPVQNTKPVTL
jgi:hypothetical protein